MPHIALSSVLALMLIFVAAPAWGSTIDVRVLSANFTAFVALGLLNSNPSKTKTSMGPEPVSASLSQTYCQDEFFNQFECDDPNSVMVLSGDAAADWLEVSAFGSGGLAGIFTGAAIAEANSEWTFSPVRDGVAYIGILGSNGFHESLSTASLFDLTTN